MLLLLETDGDSSGITLYNLSDMVANSNFVDVGGNQLLFIVYNLIFF